MMKMQEKSEEDALKREIDMAQMNEMFEKRVKK